VEKSSGSVADLFAAASAKKRIKVIS